MPFALPEKMNGIQSSTGKGCSDRNEFVVSVYFSNQIVANSSMTELMGFSLMSVVVMNMFRTI